MLRRSALQLKKDFTVHPGLLTPRGAKNVAWRPKIPTERLAQYDWPFTLETPGNIPASWRPLESRRLGLQAWPKEVGFYNAGDNFELTPEMQYRLMRAYKDHPLWTAEHSERSIIAQFPVVEQDPATGLARVQEAFAAHVERFGADHLVYNAVMQARAFAKDYDGAVALFKEMKSIDLIPNAQTYFNLMFAAKMAGKPKQLAETHFQNAVAAKALGAVVRMDVEFEMWWSQMDRMGSFTAKEGYLSNKEEGAVPLPRDPFAIWGWDRSERKFVSHRDAVKAEADRRTRAGGMTGAVYNSVLREPWWKFRGTRPYNYKGPAWNKEFRDVNADAPSAVINPYTRRRSEQGSRRAQSS